MSYPVRYGWRRSGRRLYRWQITMKIPGTLEWTGIDSAITETGAKRIVRKMKREEERMARQARMAVKET